MEQIDAAGSAAPTKQSNSSIQASAGAEPESLIQIAEPRRDRGLLALLTPGYALGFGILAAMVLGAGFWNVIADTRTLSGLIASGLIALGEDDPGLVGVPGVHLWIRSQEPVAWMIVALAAGLFAAVQVLKGYQLHRIAKFVGMKGNVSQHMRAFIYGNGVGRMLPYDIGSTAWAAALQAQGSGTLEQSARMAFIFKTFQLVEIGVFAFIGLIMSGLLYWATSLVPPLLILGAATLILRTAAPPQRAHVQKPSAFKAAGDLFSELTQTPQTFVVLLLLSLTSFTLVEVASYIVPVSFATPTVAIIQDELRYVVFTPSVIVMAVVGGYIARLKPVTPGGIGQFELAFAAVLMANELPFAAAVVLTLLVSGVRYLTGLLVFGVMMLSYGIETNFQQVREIFVRDTDAQGDRA